MFIDKVCQLPIVFYSATVLFWGIFFLICDYFALLTANSYTESSVEVATIVVEESATISTEEASEEEEMAALSPSATMKTPKRQRRSKLSTSQSALLNTMNEEEEMNKKFSEIKREVAELHRRYMQIKVAEAEERLVEARIRTQIAQTELEAKLAKK